jgi:hypothetical protein
VLTVCNGLIRAQTQYLYIAYPLSYEAHGTAIQRQIMSLHERGRCIEQVSDFGNAPPAQISPYSYWSDESNSTTFFVAYAAYPSLPANNEGIACKKPPPLTMTLSY